MKIVIIYGNKRENDCNTINKCKWKYEHSNQLISVLLFSKNKFIIIIIAKLQSNFTEKYSQNIAICKIASIEWN